VDVDGVGDGDCDGDAGCRTRDVHYQCGWDKRLWLGPGSCRPLRANHVCAFLCGTHLSHLSSLSQHVLAAARRPLSCPAVPCD